MSNQWEDDEFFDGDEETDLGEETPVVQKPVVAAQASVAPIVTSSPGSFVRPVHKQKPGGDSGKGKRTVRVRPMPPSMTQKWPDVVSCLLTLGSGKQVMFVKGG